MNIYRLLSGGRGGYDTYDSAVVVAANEHDAALTHPFCGNNGEWHKSPDKYSRYDWCEPEQVSVRLVGVATDDMNACVLCASFNAG